MKGFITRSRKHLKAGGILILTKNDKLKHDLYTKLKSLGNVFKDDANI